MCTGGGAPESPVPSAECRVPKKMVVKHAAVRRAVVRATEASAKLEGRAVPAGSRSNANSRSLLHVARATASG
jgi:hypothetical protein